MQTRHNHQAHRGVSLIDLVAGGLLLAAVGLGVVRMLGDADVWYWGVLAAMLAIAIWVRSGIGSAPPNSEPANIDNLIDQFQERH